MDAGQLFEDVTNGYLKVQRCVKKVGLLKQAQQTLMRTVFSMRETTMDLLIFQYNRGLCAAQRQSSL